jgi:FO synthase subunit 2
VTNSSITAPVTDILAKARSGANLSAKEAIILLETTDNRLIAQIR